VTAAENMLDMFDVLRRSSARKRKAEQSREKKAG
jgi:hypothetical protein